tara:strand:- start:1046 stop:1354 length:309 start_codon:yes stop_codon:yes gene_type:complete
MPYTKEELENNEYYKNLRDEDEQLYLAQRELYKTAFLGNGGTDDGSLLVRDADGTILLFENPWTEELYRDETTTLIQPLDVVQFKINEDILNDVIDRDIVEI